MRAFLARILITAFGLWIADQLLRGITFGSVRSLFIAALLLGLINAFIRPIIVLLTLPITLVTLGLFLLIINGAMLMLVAALMPSFHIGGFGSAVLAWLILVGTGWIANGFVGGKRVQIRAARR